MNRLHAARTGVRRGWTEFVQSLRSPQDQGFYLFFGVATLVYLWVNRGDDVPGTDLSFPVVALPSLLAAVVLFNALLGPAFALATEREDGTLLRAKAVPGGMTGYVVGQVVYHSLGLFPMLAVILVPSVLLFDGVLPGGSAWLQVAGVLALGMLATMPVGMVIGSLVPTMQKVTTWGMLPVLVLTAISGIFAPLQALWGWLQVVAQAFPLYWLGLGLRASFLPDAAAAIEVGGSWRPLGTVLVLGAWSLAGLVLAPVVLRRAARRQSGSAVEAARQQAMQVVR